MPFPEARPARRTRTRTRETSPPCGRGSPPRPRRSCRCRRSRRPPGGRSGGPAARGSRAAASPRRRRRAAAPWPWSGRTRAAGRVSAPLPRAGRVRRSRPRAKSTRCPASAAPAKCRGPLSARRGCDPPIPAGPIRHPRKASRRAIRRLESPDSKITAVVPLGDTAIEGRPTARRATSRLRRTRPPPPAGS